MRRTILFLCTILSIEVQASISPQDSLRVLQYLEKAEKLSLKQPDSAKIYLKQALSLSEKNSFLIGLSNSTSILAKISYEESNFLPALIYYKRSMAYYGWLNKIPERIQAMNKVSSCQRRLGNYEEAISVVQKAIDENPNHNYKHELAESYNALGTIYRVKGVHENALKYFLLSLKISKESNDKVIEAISYNNIALVKKDQLRYEEAVADFEKALEIATKVKNTKTIWYAHNYLGEVYLQLKEYDKAERNLKGSYEIINDAYHDFDKVNSFYNFYLLYKETNKPEEAVKYLNQGLTLAKKIGDAEKVLKFTDAFAQLYAEQNDFKKAYEYERNYIHVKDSLYNATLMNKLDEIKLDQNIDMELLKLQDRTVEVAPDVKFIPKKP